MNHIPLKQYMDSKRQLLKAIENTPATLIEYEIRKYCTISIGESVDEAVIVALKPKQTITVEWVYNTPTKPNVGSIIVADGIKQSTYWSDDKLTNWLTRYAKPGKNNGHKL